jgi:hypothetical protein
VALGSPEGGADSFFACLLVLQSVLRMAEPSPKLGEGRFDAIDDGGFGTIAVRRSPCEQESQNDAAFDGRLHRV